MQTSDERGNMDKTGTDRRPIIKETIVVEGRDDVTAVKRAVRCDFIITHGFGIKERTFKQIALAQKHHGVIILTDPDYAGEQIRARINKRIKGCKHAFVPREEAMLGDNIGVENASPESILTALKRVHVEKMDNIPLFVLSDLHEADLIGMNHASERRAKVGKILGIGYCSGKQFLNRLNHYGITRQAFLKALREIEPNGKG